MQQAIQEIVLEIPSGCSFDSHFVIARLIKRDYDAYLRFVADRFDAATIQTNRVHGQMAEQITNLEEQGIVERLPQESWSENVQGNPSPCACWRKR